MTTTKTTHTPGKCHANPFGYVGIMTGKHSWTLIARAPSDSDHDGKYSTVPPIAERDANLARLAACWNACQGMPTDLLESLKDGAIPKLLEQRRELLEAAKVALAYLQSHLPKGNIKNREHFHALNEHANGVTKPLYIAIQKAESPTVSAGAPQSDAIKTELVEALRDILSVQDYCDFDRESYCTRATDEFEAALNQARAALAKAQA